MAKIQNNIALIAFVMILLCTSCAKIALSLYGLREPKTLSQEEIVNSAISFKIPAENSFVSGSFCKVTVGTFTPYHDSLKRKNHLQPLQALYYDSTGTLVSYQVNCYAGGFPNLNWERDSIFESFPPRSQAPADSMLSREIHTDFATKLPGNSYMFNNFSGYTVIVYWNKFMGRQSRRFIEIVQENSKLAGTKRVKIVYINNDAWFAE